MTISPRGIALIKEFETFKAKAYLCPAGVWTIGYGTTQINGTPVQPDWEIDEPTAVWCLEQDCTAFQAELLPFLKVQPTQNQLDALISFVYNLGVGSFARSSLLRAFNSGLPVTEDLFTRWNKARDPKTGKLVVLNGLTRRRRREYELFSEV
jgi:lysozyme